MALAEWNNSLKLILKKENALMPFPENYFSDIMIGFHKFISNGSVIEIFPLSILQILVIKNGLSYHEQTLIMLMY